MTEWKKGIQPSEPRPAPEGVLPPLPKIHALFVGLDAGNAGLAGHWLREAGWEIRDHGGPENAYDLVVFESRSPRPDIVMPVARSLRGRRGVPVLMISPAILAGTPACGSLARELGVDALLPVPLERGRFVGLCARLVHGSGEREGRG